MVNLRMDDEEAMVLRRVLDSYISDLRMEVSNTSLMEFRERLKHEEFILKELLGRLPLVQPMEQ
jgi:hypothetical protein